MSRLRYFTRQPEPSNAGCCDGCCFDVFHASGWNKCRISEQRDGGEINGSRWSCDGVDNLRPHIFKADHPKAIAILAAMKMGVCDNEED